MGVKARVDRRSLVIAGECELRLQQAQAENYVCADSFVRLRRCLLFTELTWGLMSGMVGSGCKMFLKPMYAIRTLCLSIDTRPDERSLYLRLRIYVQVHRRSALRESEI
jgi:hypothetical protein